jgi:hypothetical protein
MTDEARTGRFQEALRACEATFAGQVTQQATEHELRVEQWEDDFAVLAGRLKDATNVEQAERITRFYEPAERQERIRVNTYAALCVTFIAVAIVAAGIGLYAHQTTERIDTIVSSATLFTLLSSAAGITRREQRVHRDRLWAVENDHRRMVGSVLFYPEMTDSQRERFVDEFFNESLRSGMPKVASSTRTKKAMKIATGSVHNTHEGEPT